MFHNFLFQVKKIHCSLAGIHYFSARRDQNGIWQGTIPLWINCFNQGIFIIPVKYVVDHSGMLFL